MWVVCYVLDADVSDGRVGLELRGLAGHGKHKARRKSRVEWKGRERNRRIRSRFRRLRRAFVRSFVEEGSRKGRARAANGEEAWRRVR